jgi:hypothetical protein
MARKDPPKTPDEAALKRLAMGLFLQMPIDLDEADHVIVYLRELVKWHRNTPYAWVEQEAQTPPSDAPTDIVPFLRRG